MFCSWIAPNLEHCPGYHSPALNPEKIIRKHNANVTIFFQVENTTGLPHAFHLQTFDKKNKHTSQ